MRSRTTILAAAAVGLLAIGVPTAQAAKREPLAGTWQQLVNCAVTSYDPITHRMTCVGSTRWEGTWTGVTRYAVTCTYDPLTGDTEGTLTETFRGRARDGSRGKLEFDEQFTIVGVTSQIHIDATIVGGSGDFAGARGDLTFDGTNNAATGNGTYAGWWSRKRPQRAGTP